jgi:hypothetical protein
MNRKEVEVVRKKAVSALCSYSHQSAYVHLRAADLEKVCLLALDSFPEVENVEQIRLAV